MLGVTCFLLGGGFYSYPKIAIFEPLGNPHLGSFEGAQGWQPSARNPSQLSFPTRSCSMAQVFVVFLCSFLIVVFALLCSFVLDF